MVWLLMDVPDGMKTDRRFVDLSEVKQVRAVWWYSPQKKRELRIRFFNRYGKLIGSIGLPADLMMVSDSIVQRVVRLIQEGKSPKLVKFEGTKLLVFVESKNEWVIDVDFSEKLELKRISSQPEGGA